MKFNSYLACLTVVLGATFSAGSAAAQELVLYSGRSKNLVEPIVQRFEKDTGITVNARYGGTAQLAITLQEEGDRSPADLFWAQDAGALGATAQAGLFAELPSQITQKIPERFRGKSGQWVGVSGRARVLAYSPDRVSEGEMPASVFDLTDPRYRGRIGWAPGNGSFQAFLTAMRKTEGEQKAEQWLRGMKNNGAQVYRNNTSIVRAIAAEEIDLGLPNHYYLLRFKKVDSGFPVEQTFFESGDVGNLVLVAGIGRLKSSSNAEEANRFIEYILSAKAQQYFTSDVFEYPMTDSVIPNQQLVSYEELQEKAPAVNVNELGDLEGTLDLLRKVGLL